MTRTRRAQCIVLAPLVATAFAAMLVGCGFGEDTTLNRARKALVAGDVERARALVNRPDVYSADLSRALTLTLDLPADPSADWPDAARPVLAALGATYRRARDDERTAIDSYLSDRQLRRTRATVAAADFAVELLVSWLAAAPASALLTSPALATDVALLATRSLDPTVVARAETIRSALDTQATQALAAALSHDDPTVRASAVRWLGRLRTDEALAALLPLVGEETEFEPLYELPLALGAFPGADAAAPLAAMLALREDFSHVTPSGPARAQAMAQLGRLLHAEPSARAAGIPVVLAGLTDEYEYVRSHAASILADLRHDAIPPLLELLAGGWRDAPLPIVALLQPAGEAEARVALVETALAALAPLTEPTVMTAAERSHLVGVLRDALSDDARRPLAVDALAALGSDGASALYPLLDAEDAGARALAAAALATMGEDASVEPIAARIERETEAEPLTAMVAALAALDGRAVVTLADILVAAAAGRPDVLTAVATALADALEAGADAAPVTAAAGVLKATATSDSAREDLRRAAIRALALLAPAGIETTMRDIMLSEHATPLIRKSAASALTSLGPRGQMALGAMEEILHIRREDPDDFLKRLRKRHGSEASLNAAWSRLGWETGFGNFREVKVIPSVLRSEVVRSVHVLGGPTSAALLADVLRDDQSAAVRAVAASRLADAPAQVDALLRALRKDDSGTVRAACAIALGELGAPSAEKALLRVVDRDDYEQARRQAAIALGSLGGERAVKGLAALLIEDEDDEDERLSTFLTGDIAAALAAIGDAATRHVLPGMQHYDASVRRAVVQVLTGSQLPAARSALRAALTDDPSPRVRAAAAEGYGLLASAEGVDTLIAVLENDGEWAAVRAAAAGGLGRRPGTRADDSLVAHLRDSCPTVRAACATALGALGSEDAARPLAQLAENASDLSSVRVAAVEALGQVGSSAAPALVRLATTEIGAVRAAAVTALVGIDGPGATAALAAIAEFPAEPRALRSLAAGE